MMYAVNNHPGDWCSSVRLDDAPQFSRWPARIIGSEPWQPPEARDARKLNEEYGGKWGRLFSALKDKEDLNSLEECIDYLMRTHFSRKSMCFHVGENIYYTQDMTSFWNFAYKTKFGIIKKYLHPSDTFVELGCGWGRNIFWAIKEKLCEKCIGGEFTREGVELGRRISQRFNVNAEFHSFDFLNPSSTVLEKIRGAVVFTSQSIEQISLLPEQAILSLAERHPKAVVHFEPVYEYLNKNTLLHLLWRRYAELNKYNQNLLTVLRSMEKIGKINILSEEVHAFGLNAFNPGSFIVWAPAVS